MKNLRLLSTTAAVLLLGAGAVLAQDMKKNETSEAPAAQQNAPAEKTAPALKSDRSKAPEKAGQAAPMAPQSGKKQSKSETMDKGAAPSTAAKGPSESTNDVAKPSANGQGAAADTTKLSAEQRTKISAVVTQHKVAPVKLDVSVSVGTRVPDSVHFYPLPQEVFVIYPEWRGYDYILVGDQIIVVDPRTHQIVAILEA